LKYTGREDEGNGLYQYRARYYDPKFGFISEDPLGFAAGPNFYAYVGNNPVNYNDPSGLVSWGDAWNSGVNLLSNVAGTFVGGTITASGAGLLAAPEPFLTKAGGVGAMAFGGTLTAKSVAGVGLSINNLVNAFQDRPANMPGSLAEVIAPSNANAQRAAQIIDLGLDLASGRVRPDKMLELNTGIPGLKWGTAAETIQSTYGAGGKAFNTISDTFQATAAVNSLFTSGQDIAVSLGFGGSTSNQSMQSFEQLSAQGAAGGFLLYPNKSNSNMMQSVYGKP
jgi:RHS repeat-associated protein